MLNHIWAFLIAIGVLVGFGKAIHVANTGQMVTREVDGREVQEFVRYETTGEKIDAFAAAGNAMTQDVFEKASLAVEIAITFIGMMALWLGFMKIAEASGLIQLLARAISPLFRFIFPRVPSDHPATGAILMNFAANMLGLDNAATPLGIKAMKELQELNGRKDTASNAMAMFLSLNVSSLVIIPANIIGYRVAKESENPTAFWVPMLIATFCGTITAFLLCKIAERIWPDTPLASEVPPEELARQTAEGV